MNHSAVSERKRAQKESLLFQELSKLFMKITLDDQSIKNMFINRVTLSKDKGVVNVFFYTPGGEAEFNTLFKRLVLYKPSLRKALASIIDSRYTPELVFRFDDVFEKQQSVENIFARIDQEKTEPENE